MEQAIEQCLDEGHAALVPRETMIDAPIDQEDVAVYPYTVNDPKRAEELAAFGVSGIITDDPGLIRQHFEATP